MKYLGIDYGEAKIGLAISEGELARPFGVVEIGNWELGISNICKEEDIEKIIIGVSEGKMAEETRKFGDEIHELTNLPVDYQDETLTSQMAVEKMNESGKPRMKKRTDEHGVAAAIILQDYLDNNNKFI